MPDTDYLAEHNSGRDCTENDSCSVCAIRAQTTRLEALVAKLVEMNAEPEFERCEATMDGYRCGREVEHVGSHSAEVGVGMFLNW